MGTPVPGKSKHTWYRAVRNHMPVLKCNKCPVVWWPDRPEPRSDCPPDQGK